MILLTTKRELRKRFLKNLMREKNRSKKILSKKVIKRTLLLRKRSDSMMCCLRVSKKTSKKLSRKMKKLKRNEPTCRSKSNVN